MSHPVYLPSATIEPGYTSFRAISPSGSDELRDESSDLELDDDAYAKKISNEIGLARLTNEEYSAAMPVLLPRKELERKNPTKDTQAKIHANLSARLAELTRGDRFRATNLYAPPPQVSLPTISAFPLTGPSVPPPPPPSSNTLSRSPSAMAGTGAARDWGYHSRVYALPAEPPVASVPDPDILNSGARVDALLASVINENRALAESVRHTVLGGDPDAGLTGSASGHDTIRNSVSTVGADSASSMR
ncbi:hypothetical protein FRB99_007029 [Tulasnella sp. 403]|nr:hypothetical protein FRB99_007029 [Tulasnella sp. 403]